MGAMLGFIYRSHSRCGRPKPCAGFVTRKDGLVSAPIGAAAIPTITPNRVVRQRSRAFFGVSAL